MISKLSLISPLLLFIFASCQHLSDYGPVNFEKTDIAGNPIPADNYNIVDITTENLDQYNQKQATVSGSNPPINSTLLYTDKVRAYDKLTLLVLDAGNAGAFANSDGPTTFGPIEVPKSGTISFPYAGNFNALGKSLHTLQGEIQSAYATVFNTAEVSLNRIDRRPIRANVIGRVKNAGQHDLDRDGITLSDLLASSGGAELDPHMNHYHLHRQGKSYHLNPTQLAKRDLLAQDGDVLEVSLREDHSVVLMGAVRRPGNHSFPNQNSTLADFLGSSSGLLLQNSNVKGIYLVRDNGTSKQDIYRFDLKKPEGLIHARKFYMHGKDLVYVSEAPLSRFNRAFRSILPFANQASSVAAGGAL